MLTTFTLPNGVAIESTADPAALAQLLTAAMATTSAAPAAAPTLPTLPTPEPTPEPDRSNLPNGAAVAVETMAADRRTKRAAHKPDCRCAVCKRSRGERVMPRRNNDPAPAAKPEPAPKPEPKPEPKPAAKPKRAPAADRRSNNHKLQCTCKLCAAMDAKLQREQGRQAVANQNAPKPKPEPEPEPTTLSADDLPEPDDVVDIDSPEPEPEHVAVPAAVTKVTKLADPPAVKVRKERAAKSNGAHKVGCGCVACGKRSNGQAVVAAPKRTKSTTAAVESQTYSDDPAFISRTYAEHECAEAIRNMHNCPTDPANMETLLGLWAEYGDLAQQETDAAKAARTAGEMAQFAVHNDRGEWLDSLVASLNMVIDHYSDSLPTTAV